jgi:hypothetical protein
MSSTQPKSPAVTQPPALTTQPTPKRPKTDTQPKEKSVKKSDNVLSINASRSNEYDVKLWKRSRERAGYLIRRIAGYTIPEDKYGVQYLGVVSRKPDRTSADKSKYPYAGYFNWVSLEKTGLFAKERNHEKQRKSAS